jgi:hypothetical protein
VYRKNDSPSKVGRLALGSGETKVGDTYTFSVTTTQNVLWLQVPMEDTERMAVLDSVDNLQEDFTNQSIVANVLICQVV